MTAYSDELVERVGKILHTFGCVRDCAHDSQGWEPNARIILDEIASATIADDMLTASARVLHIVGDPEFSQHDGVEVWHVGSTLEPDIPRATTERIIDLLVKEGIVRRYTLVDGSDRLAPVDYPED